MKKEKNLSVYSFILLLILGAFFVSCDNEDMMELDNSLRILVQKINDEQIPSGAGDVPRDINIELVFSHTLNTSALESALSLSSSNGEIGLNLEFSNTNSFVNITTDERLDYETNYTLSLPAGVYGQQGEELTAAFSLDFITVPFVPANVTLSTDLTTISETGETANLSITLNEAIDEDVTVVLDFGGSATQGQDYTVDNNTVVLPAGETSALLLITAQQDDAIEGTETIEITIQNITNATELTPQSVSISILDDDIDSNGDGVPDRGFIINEVLFDPPGGDAGDANGDGTRSASADEFIEFVNDSDRPVDLSGFTLFDEDQLNTGDPRHVFPEGTIVPPGGVYVLFGGGNPSGDFGSAEVGVSTTGNMNLNNADDNIYIFDLDGNLFLFFSTQGEGAGLDFGADQSVTRMPDINGDFVLHTTANPDLNYSPGKKSDGTDFAGGAEPRQGLIINEVLFDPPGGDAGDANGDGTRSASADEFIEFVNDSDQPVDLSGFTLFDDDQLATMEPRHTFSEGTIIPPGGVYVLFGGGTPTGDFGGAQVATTTTGNMNLNNADDTITILDRDGNVFLTFSSQVEGAGLSFGEDQSVTRSPDITGGYVLHTSANPGLAFSPGTKTDGSSF